MRLPARAPTAEDKLIADAARFRERGTVVEAAAENPVQGVINVLGTVLGVNFVVIVGLFLWFLSGVFSLYALDNDTIIIAVKAAFDPFILPLLSTHMGLTFLSYGLEKAFGEGDPEDDGGFRRGAGGKFIRDSDDSGMMSSEGAEEELSEREIISKHRRLLGQCASAREFERRVGLARAAHDTR